MSQPIDYISTNIENFTLKCKETYLAPAAKLSQIKFGSKKFKCNFVPKILATLLRSIASTVS